MCKLLYLFLTVFSWCSFGVQYRALDLTNDLSRTIEFGKNQDTNNSSVHPKDHTDLSIAVIFLSTQCVCTRSYWSHINELITTTPQVQFVVVFTNPSKNNVKEKKQVATGANTPNVRFVISPDLVKKIGATKTPMAYVYGPQSQLRFKGGIANSALIDDAKEFHLRDFFTAYNPSTTEKTLHYPVLGCSID